MLYQFLSGYNALYDFLSSYLCCQNPQSHELTVSTQKPQSLMVPHGFGVSMEKQIAETAEQRKSNAYAFAMREAQKPFMGIIQSGFMMWMSGNMISIWSMMMTSMGIINPINAALGVNAYFKRVRTLYMGVGPIEGNMEGSEAHTRHVVQAAEPQKCLWGTVFATRFSFLDSLSI